VLDVDLHSVGSSTVALCVRNARLEYAKIAEK